MHWVYYFGRVIIHIMVFPFAGWRVRGRENVPERGPFIVVCNHLHIADPPIVAASLKLKAVFMAKEELWSNGWSHFWVKNFGAFPVKKGSVDREAIRQAKYWLNRGVSVIIFPEGGRSKSARLQTAFSGAALIAMHTGTPILPVSISGSDKFLNPAWCFFHRPRVTVTFGLPFNPPNTDGKPTKEQRTQLTNDIMRRIAALLPSEYRGIYDKEKTARN